MIADTAHGITDACLVKLDRAKSIINAEVAKGNSVAWHVRALGQHLFRRFCGVKGEAGGRRMLLYGRARRWSPGEKTVALAVVLVGAAVLADGAIGSGVPEAVQAVK